jgi:hypothetical protein
MTNKKDEMRRMLAPKPSAHQQRPNAAQRKGGVVKQPATHTLTDAEVEQRLEQEAPT